MRQHKWSAVAVAAWMTTAGASQATDRHFSYAIESNVLNPGTLELEPSTTFRLGRAGYYAEFDQRLELEAGIVDNVQVSLYVNVNAISEDAGVKRENTVVSRGISGEVKWKLLDASADAVGLALYFEPTVAPAYAELEAKLIADKRFGDFLAVGNVVVAHEMEWDHADAFENDSELELDLGLDYFVTSTFAVGLELRDANALVWRQNGVDARAVIFAGPTVSLTMPRFWVTATVLPQIGAPVGATSSLLSLDDHERVEARLILGVHL